MHTQSASLIMEQLVAELAKTSGPACERLIEEFSNGLKFGTGTADSPETRLIYMRANNAVEELRGTWGPTADPSWAESDIPGRQYDERDPEEDCFFALFRRPGVWGYVRMRALRDERAETACLKLILGVAKAST